MGNFQFSGLTRFTGSLWSYLLFSVCTVISVSCFFLAGVFTKHAVSFIRDKVVSCVILTKYHPTCFTVHCSRLQYCLHMFTRRVDTAAL